MDILDVLFTRIPPLTVTRTSSSREHHVSRRTTVLTSSLRLLCELTPVRPPPAGSCPSSLMTTSTSKGLGDTRLAAVARGGGRGFDSKDGLFKTMMDSGAIYSSTGNELAASVWCGTEIGIITRRRSRRPSYPLVVTRRHPRPQLTPSRETMVDQAGRPVFQFAFPPCLFLDWNATLFSPVKAMLSRVTTTLETRRNNG